MNKPLKNESLIIFIPGGPCLSGKYLEYFAYTLSQQNEMNVGLLSLPNHDDSILDGTELPLSYQRCLEFVREMLDEVNIYTNKLILFGQSFGARLAFDLLGYYEKNIPSVFLTGFPYQFEISSTLLNKLESLENITDSNNSEEFNFQKTWENMLPFYSYSSLPPDILEILSSNTRYKGNQKILNYVPPIEETINRLEKRKSQHHIAILQGENDLVVPDNNIEKLKSLIPQAQYFLIEKCGHFAMIEQQQKTLEAFSDFMNK